MSAEANSVAALIDFAVHLADLASEQIMPHFRADVGVDNKASGTSFDPVTIADRNAEAAIRAEIRRAYPQHSIMGEEHGFESGSSSHVWVLDPIDGTRAFILGQLHWGTLIALNDGTRPIVGLMRQPFTGETFIGWLHGDDKRAELRRAGTSTRLASRQSTRLENAVLCATDPTMFAEGDLRQRFERLAAKTRGVRYGGDCYTPCLIAAGCTDLVVEANLKPWDIQALVPIVEGAGGVITDWHGTAVTRADTTIDKVVIAANRALHAQALELLT